MSCRNPLLLSETDLITGMICIAMLRRNPRSSIMQRSGRASMRRCSRSRWRCINLGFELLGDASDQEGSIGRGSRRWTHGLHCT